MPTYNYECLNCLKKVEKKYAQEIADNNGNLELTIYESEVIYETSHSVNPTEEELHEACECPRCGSHKAARTFHGSKITSFTRGYGFLDKAGCYRDMNRYKLTQDDPYANYRQDGEVDHIKDKLDKGGKHNPKTQYFPVTSTKSIEKAVSDVVNKPKLGDK